MNKLMTSMELETLEYRKSRLHSKLSRLEELLSGRSGSLLPLVRGDDGHWSEEKGRALIGELMDTLECIKDAADPEEDLMIDETRQAFEGFLYCALRALEAPMPTQYWGAPRNGTWNGLIDLAEQTQFRDKYALYFAEAYGGLEISNFFFVMNEMYTALTGEWAVDRISEEERAVMEQRYREEIAACKASDEIHRQWQEALERGEVDDVFSEPVDEEELEAQRQEAAALEAWKEDFRASEAFSQAYLLFRREFFTQRAWARLRPLAEQMVDIHLYRQGTSSFLTDDTFFLAYGLLDQSEQKLRDTLKGAE